MSVSATSAGVLSFRSEVLGDPRALGHDVRAGAELFAPRRDDGCALSSLTVIVPPTMGIFAPSMSQCVGRRLYNGEVRRLAAVIVTTVFALPNAMDGIGCPDGCTHEVWRAPGSSDSLMLGGSGPGRAAPGHDS
jgi:hypothetical protein